MTTTYLLRADSERMAEWKQAALEQGIPFSDWLRRAAVAYSQGIASSPAAIAEEAAAVGETNGPPPPPVQVTPDWK